MKKPTLQSLATELGVSRQTVSNVLNAPERVHPDTRARVQEAIDASGYRPSAAARSLRSQRSMQIGLRLRNAGDGINGTVMDGFLHGLTAHANAKGYRVTLFTAGDDAEELEVLQELFETGSIDACIITDTSADDERPQTLLERGFPFAAFGRSWGALDTEHSWVDVDGKAGVKAAVEELKQAGRTRIGYIGWPQPSGVGADRRAGWVESTNYSDGERAQFEVVCIDRVEEGARAARVLHEADVDAAVCASDSLAIGAVTEFRALGSDIAVIGFDDTPVARAIGLSSLQQPLGEAAEAAVDSVLGQLADPQAPKTQSLLPAVLVRRTLKLFM